MTILEQLLKMISEKQCKESILDFHTIYGRFRIYQN